MFILRNTKLFIFIYYYYYLFTRPGSLPGLVSLSLYSKFSWAGVKCVPVLFKL